jgi:hypothetical protein
LSALERLASIYGECEHTAKAVSLFNEYISMQRVKHSENELEFAGILSATASKLLQYRQFATAEEMLRECLEIRQQAQPDDWTTFNTQSLLGAALLGQGHHPAAEPLLIAGFEGMQQRESTIPDAGQIRLTAALDRLIDLYEVIDNPGGLQKYQDLRARR